MTDTHTEAMRLAEELTWLVGEVIEERYIDTLREHQIKTAINRLRDLASSTRGDEAKGEAVAPQLELARNALDEALSFAPDSERWGRWNRGVVELDLALDATPQPVEAKAVNVEAWLPIESAPKDGTVVLIWRKHKGGEIRQARWAPTMFGETCWGGPGWSIPGDLGPTHWMPIPPAPQANQEAQ